MVIDLKRRRKTIDRVMAKYESAKEGRRQLEHDYEDAFDHLEAVKTAHQTVQTIAEEVQQTAHDNLAHVVTQCLNAVWGDVYKFKIQFEQKRGSTEARLIFERKDGLELNPMKESSGGVIDVAALALRLSCIALMRPRRRRLVVLDEPFKNVRGEHYQERVRQMLEHVCEELDFQIIINTDMPVMRTGKVIEMSKDKG